MEGQLVAVLGILWSYWMLTFLSGVHASPLTSSQQLISPVSTAASPVSTATSGPQAVLNTLDGVRHEEEQRASTTLATRQQHTMAPHMTASKGQPETLIRRRQTSECRCHDILDHVRVWNYLVTEIERSTFYLKPGEQVTGISVGYESICNTSIQTIYKPVLSTTSSDWYGNALKDLCKSEKQHNTCSSLRRVKSDMIPYLVYRCVRFLTSFLTLIPHGCVCWRREDSDDQCMCGEARDSLQPLCGHQGKIAVAAAVPSVLLIIVVVAAVLLIRLKVLHTSRPSPADVSIDITRDAANKQPTPVAATSAIQVPKELFPGSRMSDGYLTPKQVQRPTPEGQIYEEIYPWSA